MPTCIIAFDNKADEVTSISGGAWETNLPRNNLLTADVQEVARTTNDANASTKFRVTLPEEIPLQFFGLRNTNASQAAQYRVRCFDDSGFSTQSYTSDTLTLYPEDTIPFGDPFFGSAEWWSGVPSYEELNKYQRNIAHVLTAMTYTRYIEFELFDTDNPDGYFQAGRLFLGRIFQPTLGVETRSRDLRPNTVVSRALDGTKYFDVRDPDMSFPFALPAIDAFEANLVQDLHMTCGVHGEVFFIENPGVNAYWYRRCIGGQLAELNRVTHTSFSLYQTAFQIEGLTT